MTNYFLIDFENVQPKMVGGDSFVLRPGFRGTWQVLETTRKDYVLRVGGGAAEHIENAR